MADLKRYTTSDRVLNTNTMCANNEFNNTLATYIRRNGVLIDYTGRLKDTARRVALGDLNFAGKLGTNNDMNIAKVAQLEVQRLGLTLPDDAYKRNINKFISIYVISGLAYCSVLSRNGDRSGYLCTKNISVIRALAREYKAEHIEKDIHKYKDRFFLSQEELDENCLHAVKVVIENNTLRLRSCRIYVNSRATVLMPMFDIAYYNDSVFAALSNGVYEIAFKDGGIRRNIVCSMNRNIVRKYTRCTADFMKSEAYKVSDLAKLKLFDLRRQEFCIVDLLDVISFNKL